MELVGGFWVGLVWGWVVAARVLRPRRPIRNRLAVGASTLILAAWAYLMYGGRATIALLAASGLSAVLDVCLRGRLRRDVP
jgi:hypothetical protein